MTTTTTLCHPTGSRAALVPWVVVCAGLLALYLPSFHDLFNGAWGSEKNAHGPIVMAVSFAFLYYRVRQLRAEGLLERRPQPLVGGVVFAFGLLCYALGRSQGVLILEVGSMVPVLGGIVAAGFGVRTWARMGFAFFFMLFMVPLPPSIVDVVTLPMKIAVSYAAEHVLYWTGYPVARSGVMLSVGQYQLLVADACAGLNSLFTLEAMGLLYMNLVRHQSAVRNAVLAALIVPISFAANTIRIVCLALITYHLGDAAGQGFLHGFSGLVLFLSALLLTVGVDSLLTRLVGTPHGAEPAGPVAREAGAAGRQHMAATSIAASVAMLAAMLVAGAAAYGMTPTLSGSADIGRLEQVVPETFGDWTLMPSPTVQAYLSTGDDGAATSDRLYDQVVMRTYVNANGDQVMLALAYAKEQRQEVKLHLPEVCYPAQGYAVTSLAPAVLRLANGEQVPGMHMLASSNGRSEAVTYWTRVGAGYPRGALATRMRIFRDGLAGKVDDGMLVRASTVVRDGREAAGAYALQQEFLSQLVAATGASGALVARR